MSARVWFGPAGADLVGMEPDGTPVTASLDVGVGPMVEITAYITDIHLTQREDADVDLTTFINARLDEDEAAARLDGPDDPDAPPLGRRFTSAFNDDGQVIERLYGPIEVRPARILAQVEAMRRIVAEWRRAQDEADRGDMSGEIAAFAFELALRALATIWRDHPSYDAAWEA